MKSGYAEDQPRQLNDSCCWTELLNMAGYFSITEKFTRGQERLSSYTQVFFHKRVRKIYLSHGNAQLGPVVSTEPRWISHWEGNIYHRPLKRPQLCLLPWANRKTCITEGFRWFDILPSGFPGEVATVWVSSKPKPGLPRSKGEGWGERTECLLTQLPSATIKSDGDRVHINAR